MVEFLGVEPTSIRNTELIYSDEIGNWMADLGFKATITEGAKHILGWKSPNYLYCNAINPRLKVLLRNYSLSDDIAFRFSNPGWSDYPLTADKYAHWLKDIAPSSDIINIFMDYETFGEHQKKETGIFEFLKHMPEVVLKKTPYNFMTVSEVADAFQPVSVLHVPSAISWADEERDITAWMGNDLQTAAVTKLYSLANRVMKCGSEPLVRDWVYLQASDHFYYMSTKFFSDGDVHAYFNPYENPYQAFLNYMNILSDFEIRLNKIYPESNIDAALSNLTGTLEAKEEIIEQLEEKVTKLEKRIETYQKKEIKPKIIKAAGQKIPEKKSISKQAGKTKGKTDKKVTAKASGVTKAKAISALKSEPKAKVTVTKKRLPGKTRKTSAKKK